MNSIDLICSQDSIANHTPIRCQSPSPSTSPQHVALHVPEENAVPSTTSVCATSQGDEGATTSPNRTQIKCATVTMMLANRITRNAWSVEDEHFFESNHMNVWQTLEFLSGITLRKRYNYEGYNDNNNSILALAPSWRRDSFVEKNVDPTIDEATRRKSACLGSSSPGSGKYAGTSGNDNETMHKNSHGFGGSGGGFVNGPSAGRKRTKQKDRKSTQRHQTGNSRKRSHKSQSHRRKLPKPTVLIKELDMEFALSPTDYADLIKCT
uniref:Uncharacterized protein n=1 Tax=Stomoxys calcitrans TaxID=35570 RepID=A0A1I8PYQ9_STOCA